ncbi:hypothetical protein BDZ91DRAFT_773554 [Kalaharituber pfeilii]|nr:hypothetical protein BDZ91DRAFT_773554 [Kalaharituber pfeilii]
MGISVRDAWTDLQRISGGGAGGRGGAGFHPYNSRANDDVRKYLLQRVEEILKANGVERNGALASEEAGATVWGSAEGAEVLVVDDMSSNVTFAGTTEGLSVYFEGTNLVVVIKGSVEGDGAEGKDGDGKLGAVLVNAHYDSVSTGYGATDDGMAVVSLLQLISYFTRRGLPKEKRPKRDVVVLFNNGEEDYLNGARAFAVSPWGKLPKIFYNLEGAGAGGRSTLFRTSDTEVTAFYKRSVKRPFGSSVSADGFKKGLVRSQTDYLVFTEDMGLRGLDVAFWRPRSKYHTEDDSVRFTSRESVWHMLGGAIQTVEGMAMDTRKEFEAGFEVGGTDSVWFDMFGRAFVLFRLHTLFAISVTLATTTPLVIFVTIYLLARAHKLYMFSNAPLQGKSTQGWKGFFVFPAALLLATSAVIGTVFLLVKANPMIVYGHLYTVWTCFLSIWFMVAWAWWRASALTRGYGFGWLWLFWWIMLVFTAFLEDKKGITGFYWVIFFYAGAFLSFWISLLEQFALPPKDIPANHLTGNHQALSPSENQPTYADGSRLFPSSSSYDQDRDRSATNTNPSADTSLHHPVNPDDDATPPTETSPLLSARRGSTNSSFRFRFRRSWPRTFRRYVDPDDASSLSTPDSDAPEGETAVERRRRIGVYKYEQRWSRDLPTGWGTVPVPIILVGQIGLFLGEALGMTGADGSDLLTVYLGIAMFSVLYLLPILPFMHRVTHHLAYLALFLSVATVIFNLVAFPFTSNARLKVYFQQTYDLAQGNNTVHIVGVEPYIRTVIENEFPSARGKEVVCTDDWARKGLRRCSWDGGEEVAPRVVKGVDPKDWVQFNVTRLDDREGNDGKKMARARIEVVGSETRACKLTFEKGIGELAVVGLDVGDEGLTTAGGKYPGHYPEGEARGGRKNKQRPGFEDRSPVYQPGGTREVRLWSREWERGWRVDVGWEKAEENAETDKLKGKVVCLWSDVNEKGTLPAWDEVSGYLPKWAVASKLTDGLVDASWGLRETRYVGDGGEGRCEKKIWR